MKRKFLKLSKGLILAMLWGFSLSIFAQNISVQGTVKDASSNSLIGVTIQVQGTSHGTVTDLDGKFKLDDVPSNGKLLVSYIGMRTQTIVVNNQTTLAIIMLEDVAALDEVIVVGYGGVERRDLTSAVSKVTSKDFLSGAYNNPMQMIDGKVAGVTISNFAAADPNRDPMANLQVRGSSSLEAGNTPLVVIDGMPGGDLRNLSNQDIESITVLKDGSAAAIYGSRAANGVIIVQTKSGKAGKVSITYDGYIEQDFVNQKPDILSPEEFVERNRDTDYGAKTLWYDELLRKNNFGQNHYLALGGGSENSVFRISANFKEKTGIDIASDREEYGIRANFHQTTLEGFLELTGNISHRIVDESYANYGAFKQAVQLNPTIPMMDAADPTKYYYFKGFDTYNPVGDLKDRINGAKQEYNILDFTIKLNLLSNLNTELKVARQGHVMKKYEYYNSNHRESLDNNRHGRARLQSENWEDKTLEWIGNYYTTLNSSHNIKLMAGYSYQEFNNEGFWAENMDFPTDAFDYNKLSAGKWNLEKGRLGMDSWKSKEKNVAFFGRLNYDFEGKYLLTASLRREGNTKFGKDHKWGWFPAASAAWRLSQLSFFEDKEAVDDLKARISYGVTGRSGFARYTALSRYTGYGRYLDDNGLWIQVFGPANNPNNNLHWERQESWNFGLDYTLFNHRLTGSIDYFIRLGNDVIAWYDAPVPPNIHQQIFTNVGSTSTKGLELNIEWNAIKTRDFDYNTNIIASYAKSVLDKFSNDTYTKGYMDRSELPSPGNPGPSQRLEEGVEIGSFRGLKFAGVDDKGYMLIWEKGVEGGTTKPADQSNDEDKTYLGHGMPRLEVSWGNTIRYKSLDLSLFFRGKFDYKILNLYQMYFGLQHQPKINLLKDAFTRNEMIKGPKHIVDYFLESGDYFKLDNITLGYTPKLQTKWISSMRVYATVRNVFTLTKYSGLDPANTQIAGLDPGIGSLDLYPSTTNLSFGVQITY
ncbi:MAG: SusC/RagA family TonB-linked outer membrane protein [Candidatus Saccharimonadaceae bacterium]